MELMVRQQSSFDKLAELDSWRTSTILDMPELELLKSVTKSVEATLTQ